MRKWKKRWIWNEESYRSHVKKGEESVTYIYFFSKWFYLIPFSKRRVKVSSRQKLSLNFHCFQLPATLETPQEQALTVIQHICLWLQRWGRLGCARGSCWDSMRTWKQSRAGALEHGGRLGSSLLSNRLKKASCQLSLCSDGFIYHFVVFLLALFLRGQALPDWRWWAAFLPENPTGRSDLGLWKLVAHPRNSCARLLKRN